MAPEVSLDIPDQPDEWADANRWAPTDSDTGAVIAGDLVGRKTVASRKFDNEFEILFVQEKGEPEPTEVPCGRSHLAALVREKDPQVGDRVLIKFFGREDDTSPYLYALRVDKNGQPPL